MCSIKPLLRLLIAGVLSLAVVGVASAAVDLREHPAEGLPGQSTTAWWTWLHASPDAPAVDVYLDDAKIELLTNVPFGVISGSDELPDIEDVFQVPAGDHNLKVYATGDATTPFVDADVTFAADGAYLVAITNEVAAMELQVMEYAPFDTPDPSKTQVRFFHLSADAPAVDVAVAGADPADAITHALAYPDGTAYQALPASADGLEVRLAGTTTAVLALPDVKPSEDVATYTAFLIGSAAEPAVGGNPLQGLVVAVPQTDTGGNATATPPPASGGDATLPATDTIAATTDSSSGGVGLALAVLAAVAVTASVIALGRRSAARR